MYDLEVTGKCKCYVGMDYAYDC